MEIIRNGDVTAFADHVYNFDNVVGLESWHLKLLNRVKMCLDDELARLEDMETSLDEGRKQQMVDRQARFKVSYKKKS